MNAASYLDGSYLELHPDWHVEDSEWKASHVLSMLRRNNLTPENLLELGCGAGKVLACLQGELPAGCTFRGYEMSPAAYAMCSKHENHRLRFFLQTAETQIDREADLVLALDVLEHTQDYLSFLTFARDRAPWCILHVPLDLSLQSLVCGLPQRVRKTAGHLHYFTSPILKAAVEASGFTIVDAKYTRPAIERGGSSLRTRFARIPRMLLAAVNEDLAALTLGGFSMLILAKRTHRCD